MGIGILAFLTFWPSIVLMVVGVFRARRDDYTGVGDLRVAPTWPFVGGRSYRYIEVAPGARLGALPITPRITALQFARDSTREAQMGNTDRQCGDMIVT